MIAADMACSYHEHSNMPSVPWLPKRTPFNVSNNQPSDDQSPKRRKTPARSVPSLLPIAIASGSGIMTHDSEQDHPCDMNDEIVSAQIKINTNALKEIENLRNERLELMVNCERMAKENQFFKARLNMMTEQFEYVKKKMAKKTNVQNDGVAEAAAAVKAAKDAEVAKNAEAAEVVEDIENINPTASNDQPQGV